MASSGNKGPKDEPYSRPPQSSKPRRASSDRVAHGDVDDFNGPQNDAPNYTVSMPATPDNQPAAASIPKSDRPESFLRSKTKSVLLRSQTGDFDHNRWLFETKGKYGVGSAYWTKGNFPENDANISMSDFLDKPWKPLTRKVKVPTSILSPYRLIIATRFVALVLFISWRVTNSNEDAMWLWGTSVVCEIWFAFSWVLDVLPKFNPINRATDLAALHDKFDKVTTANPSGRSDLPGVDVFVSTADPEKEPPLVTANTILSILAVDYPVEKLSCYISDDGGAILTFEAMAEAVRFAEFWVPFCRKHDIEPRNPESYFNLKRDPTKNKKLLDFVKDRRWIKREYDEFKVRINALPETIRKRSDAYNKKKESIAKEQSHGGPEDVKVEKATWMTDGTHWPGTWIHPVLDHSKGDHAGILQVMSNFPESDVVKGKKDDQKLDLTEVDVRIPMFSYVSREKRPGHDHNKKAGAMNALVRASAIISNGPFILNLDCDHYVYNCLAVKEGLCFMMDRGGDRLCYIQFPQRFEGIDPSDRYANHNTVFFDGSMRALDGLQGPVYVGTGCMFRRYALYGFLPPRANEYTGLFGRVKSQARTFHSSMDDESDTQPLKSGDHEDFELPKKFGESVLFADTIPIAEYQGRPLADHITVKNGRAPGALLAPRPPLDAQTVAEAVAVISCWYEDKTEWGQKIGWIYGSVTEDVVTGYRMHNRGWRSVYCVTKRDAFRGTAPINLTDRLHQVLRWATGSVEIFFSENNALLGTRRLKFLQRVAYFNVGIYPFTSIFLVVYCFLPALSLFTGHFIVESLNIAFLSYLLIITVTLMMLSILEVRWSGIALEELWRNEQFWLIGGTSAHLVAVVQGLLKIIAGIEISFTLTSKSAGDDEEDVYADLYMVKWTSLFIMPLTQWSKLIGGVFFSFWVLSHLYPFAKGLAGKRGRPPTIVYVWSGLFSIIVSLLWISISPPSGYTTEGTVDI